MNDKFDSSVVGQPRIYQDPLTDKYTIFAPQRSKRPFQENIDCPFCPGSHEVPEAFSGIRSLPNKFAALQPNATGLNPTKGLCEVILYSSDHSTPVYDKDVTFIKELIKHWIARYDQLVQQYDFVKYIFPFENYGKEIGVSLDHPHGQLYALPMVPPLIKRKQSKLKRSSCIYCHDLDQFYEVMSKNGMRIMIPKYGTWPVQIQIIPERHISLLSQLRDIEVNQLAFAIQSTLGSLERLYGKKIPYIFSIYQVPVDGDDFHLHLEIISPQISKDKIKYRAGLETSLDVFVNSNDLEQFASWLIEELL